MIVSLGKHGGLGAIRWPSKSIDTSQLSHQEVAELECLLKGAEAETSSAQESSPRGRDVMFYAVTIEDAAGSPRLLQRSDVSLSPAFAALIDWIERKSRSV